MSSPLPKSLPAFLWFFIRQQWGRFIVIGLLAFAWSIDHTLWPYLLKLVIDAISGFTGDRSTIFTVLAVPLWSGAALWLFIEFSFRTQGILMAKLWPRFEASIRMKMMEYVSAHSHQYFSNNFSGAIANKINDMPQSATRIMQLILTLFIPASLALVIALCIYASLHPLFAVLLGGWVTIHVGICLCCAKRCDYYSTIHSEARSQLSGKIVDSLSNFINVKLFARRRFELSYLSDFQEDERRKHYTSLWYVEKVKIALGVACFLLAGAAINIYSLYCWQHNVITTGDMVLIFNTNWNIIMLAWYVGLELPHLFKEIGTCKQALSLIQAPHEITDSPDAVPLQVTEGTIAFDQVTFNYTRNNNIFSNKSVMLAAGNKIGLVGFSGSGKTTFANLILRFFEVESGRILIDGQDIAKVTQDSLHEQISMIPQDTSLFHRTLMENIRYGRLQATDEEVIAASKQAHCHEFISQLPEGYHSLVGERGIKLSGGQRQRIAIARAILKNAPILILDEATSALDSVTEKHIQEGLHSLMQNRTTIVIAHRLSTLSEMDRILVFDKGRIIEDGTHAALLSQNGHYARMWHMQAGGFLPEVGD